MQQQAGKLERQPAHAGGPRGGHEVTAGPKAGRRDETKERDRVKEREGCVCGWGVEGGGGGGAALVKRQVQQQECLHDSPLMLRAS